MNQINIVETQNLINRKEATIAQMERARIEAQAKKDSLRNQYKEYTEEFKLLIEKAKPLLNIEGDIAESEILSKLTEEIKALIEDLNNSIPDNL